MILLDPGEEVRMMMVMFMAYEHPVLQGSSLQRGLQIQGEDLHLYIIGEKQALRRGLQSG